MTCCLRRRSACDQITHGTWNCPELACNGSQTAAVQAENLDVAFGLLEEMRARGVQPDDITYSTLLNLCAEARQGHQALQLMQVPLRMITNQILYVSAMHLQPACDQRTSRPEKQRSCLPTQSPQALGLQAELL